MAATPAASRYRYARDNTPTMTTLSMAMAANERKTERDGYWPTWSPQSTMACLESDRKWYFTVPLRIQPTPLSRSFAIAAAAKTTPSTNPGAQTVYPYSCGVPRGRG